ncbi:hypothetical protein QFZ48_002849 [Chitinophaga sp. W2I13]|uniref:hypothetical protein n=1 Tax=Chitinophaga sp. W2I13 TaxID=3373923 RepID=UPI003D199864
MKKSLKRFGRKQKLITFATPTTTGQQTESESCSEKIEKDVWQKSHGDRISDISNDHIR